MHARKHAELAKIINEFRHSPPDFESLIHHRHCQRYRAVYNFRSWLQCNSSDFAPNFARQPIPQRNIAVTGGKWKTTRAGGWFVGNC